MKKAFTLIELLVVIAIIAILAAILFPVFAQAKEAAKKTQCLSNMKNVGTAVIMYLGDSDDMYPNTQRKPTLDEDATGATPVPWHNVVNPYVKNGNKTVTSGTGKNEIVGGVWNCPTSPDQKQPRQYGLNVHIGGDTSQFAGNDFGTTYGSISQTAINAPASKVLLGEKGYMGGATGTGTDTKDWSEAKLMTLQWAWNTNNFDLSQAKRADQDNDKQGNPWPWAGAMPRFRHGGSSNHDGVSTMAFADGHAKAMKLGMLGGAGGWCKYLYQSGSVTAAYGTWYPQANNGIATVGDAGCSQWDN